MLYSFHGGKSGNWRVITYSTLKGAALPLVERLSIVSGAATTPDNAAWVLRGFTSNLRYTTTAEAKLLRARQEDLGRPEAKRAALIPIRKTAQWWQLAQDERRRIFEETSRHTTIGLDYLPAIARRLHHSRDLGEPFDFLIWFEYAPNHEQVFNDLLAKLRATPEWNYVDREVEIRLERL